MEEIGMASGRAIIVTGASSGIGRALAERAARAGYAVLAIGRREDRLAELARNAAAHGGEVAVLALDLREPGAAERIVAAAGARFGRIDVLVNNAGGVAAGALSAQSDAALREQYETHVLVPLALVREALPLLRASRGHVFFIGSGVARIPVTGLGGYPSAKAAVRSIARTIRNELRPQGIGVTYVDPGAVDTEFMTRAGMAPAPRSILVSPHEVARKIFNTIGSDRGTLNAVPWQTAFVALAEHFPSLTDALLARSPQLIGGPADSGIALEPHAPPRLTLVARESEPIAPSLPPRLTAVPLAEPAPDLTARPAQVEAAADAAAANPFDAALAAHAARMRKHSLSHDFVALLLVPGASLELGDVAMRWAGMPNKKERAVTLDVLEALAEAHYLERDGTNRYRVLKAADGAWE
jgi:short-subunit dehydrogenase